MNVIDGYFLDALDDQTTRRFEKHLRLCHYCREQLDILQILSKLTREELLKKTLG